LLSIDISSHPAKIGHIDKAKPPVRGCEPERRRWIQLIREKVMRIGYSVRNTPKNRRIEL
jgi:hypothetical protein